MLKSCKDTFFNGFLCTHLGKIAICRYEKNLFVSQEDPLYSVIDDNHRDRCVSSGTQGGR